MSDKIIPIRLSHSTLELFNRCERLFELEKLLAGDSHNEESADLSLGTAYGVGVADYLINRDADRAIYKGWLAYWPEIETDKKSIPHMIAALKASFPYLDTILRDYEVVYFNGKPAAELSFRLNIDQHYYYVGYVDIVLRNRWDGVCIAVDAKSTGLGLLDLSPNYENSGQVLGYSIVLDSIVGKEQSSFAVGYFVAQLKKDFEIKIHPLIFRKTLLDRFNWFLTLGADINRLKLASDLGFYPRRGGSCVKYNRPCRHYGVCQLTSYSPKQLEEDTKEYDFVFNLDDLINDHIRRINE